MKRTHILLAIVISFGLLIYALLTLGGSGSNPATAAQHAVEVQGYTNVQYIGIDNFACGKAAGWAFDADNVNQIRVRVIACAEGDNGLINPVMGWRIVTK